MIFKRVGDDRPYPAHELRGRDWAALPPRQVRLDQLVTTKGTLDLATLLDEDSTFFGDLFAHVVQWGDELYLEDGLHRALRAALQRRDVVHARVHVIGDTAGAPLGADGATGRATGGATHAPTDWSSYPGLVD